MKKTLHYLAGTLFFLGLFFFSNQVFAAPPANFQTSLLVGSGLDSPTALEFAPDGRLFILQQGGIIKIYKNGSILPANFANLPAFANADRGLLGIAFDPDFNFNHYVYFYYVDSADLFHKVVRYNATADVGTEGPFVIYDSGRPAGNNHAGGTIQFGPDGKLYIGIGDSGHALNAGNLSVPEGKILRINKDGTIPSDNPFVGVSHALPEIWATGFRNPFRFQFDPATGRLFLGDVGESTWEEINSVTRGGNYGWPSAEGVCAGCPYVNPIYSYPHTTAGFSVTGGPVYRNMVFPEEFRGNLFFGDYAAGFLKRLILNSDGSVASTQDFDNSVGSVVDLKVGPDGAIYYVTIFPGRLYKVAYTLGNKVPTAASAADIVSGDASLEVHFSSTGSSDPEGNVLTYLWDFGDGTTSTEPNPVKVFPDRGLYVVQLKVKDDVHEALAPALQIQVGAPPTLTINSPLEGQTYNAGNVVSYSASSTATEIKLDVLLHHNIHSHPFLNNLEGISGTINIPTTGESAADTWYELIFTAIDQDGLTTKKSVRINPNTVSMTFRTSPAGLKINLDGQPTNDNTTIQGVVGFVRDVTAPNQTLGPTGYEFDHWSDGGGKTHTIETPNTNRTYTAFFRVVPPFNAQYFANQNLFGDPVLTRQDNNINFNWDQFSPAPGIQNDHFSVRWIKQHTFSFGRYEFRTASDDGSRLYIDGNLIINDWQNHAVTVHTAEIELSAGPHEIKMEYYEDGGSAEAYLSWDFTPDQPLPPDEATDYNAEYFPNIELNGAPVLTRTETEVDYVWYLGSPDPAVPNNNFSARWTKNAEFTAGDYEFTVNADDGIRLYIDDALVLDKWFDSAATSYLVTKTLSAGIHEIKLEYYEHDGNAVARLFWNPASAAPTGPETISGFKAEYFANNNLLGNPKLVRDDENIIFDWAMGSPETSIPADQFSARWTKQITFEEGKYSFSLAGDDGLRLFIDDELVLNSWFDQPYMQYTTDKLLPAGPHKVVVEYYENTGYAQINFTYAKNDSDFTAEYFNNRSLTGEPVLTRQEERLEYLFNETSPDSTVEVGNFSARWTKEFIFSEGPHNFYLQSDDGIRLYIDDVLVLDDWTDHAMRTYTPSANLTSGPHTIKVEYYQAGGGGVAIFRY